MSEILNESYSSLFSLGWALNSCKFGLKQGWGEHQKLSSIVQQLDAETIGISPWVVMLILSFARFFLL